MTIIHKERLGNTSDYQAFLYDKKVNRNLFFKRRKLDINVVYIIYINYIDIDMLFIKRKVRVSLSGNIWRSWRKSCFLLMLLLVKKQREESIPKLNVIFARNFSETEIGLSTVKLLED